MRTWLVLLALALAGCSGLNDLRDAELEDMLEVRPPVGQPLEVYPWTGFAAIHSRTVDLPRAQEDVHQGVVLIDSTPLPPGWRPRHAPAGGLLVSAVHTASPLALVGLRPYDLVLEVEGGAHPPTLASTVHALGRPRVALRVRHLDGREERLEAEAAPRVEGQNLLVTCVINAAWSHTGVTWELVSPLLWWCDSSVRYRSSRGYADSFGWGALLDLFAYRRWTERTTGETRWCVDLFWFLHLGDSPWDGASSADEEDA